MVTQSSTTIMKISAKACVFDVFGTVLDWEGGLARQLGERFGGDWAAFSHDWVVGHQQRACVLPILDKML
jgi:hypothetical protein